MHLSGVRPSVCPYVCPIYRSLQQRAAGLLQAGDIDRQPRAAGAQHHGVQQQMRAVSCLEPP